MALTEYRAWMSTIWNEFTRRGVTDTLTILEYISAVAAGATPPALFSGRSKPLDVTTMEMKLGRASLGEFVNDFLFFAPKARYADGLFPIPRHLADTMAEIARAGEAERVLDPACGTGGLLIAAGKAGAHRLTGYDIDARMVRIAQYNLRLHGWAEQATVEQGDSTQLSSPLEPTVALLAPPFGAATFSKDAVEHILGHRVSRIETALTEMALRQLTGGGRLVFLSLSRLLFGGDASERRLRIDLLRNQRITGVARLPRSALHIRSSAQPYLVSVEKEASDARALTWFATLNRDGYGAAKDLTEGARPAESDYPLWTKLLRTVPTAPQVQDELSCAVTNVPERDPVLRVIAPGEGRRLVAMRLQPEQRLLWLEVVEPDGSMRSWQVALDAVPGANRVQPVARGAAGSSESGDWLDRQPLPGGAIAITNEGGLFAVSRRQAELAALVVGEEADVDLRPESLIEVPTGDTAFQESAAELLYRIRDLNQDLSAALDRLVMQTGRQARRPGTVPDVQSGLRSGAFPMGHPSLGQTAIWQAIQDWEAEGAGNGDAARFFTAGDLEGKVPEYRAAVSGTLDLLCVMGALVPVTLSNTPGYRLATEWEDWLPASRGEGKEDVHVAQGTETV